MVPSEQVDARVKLVEVARGLFWSKGYQATSLRDIYEAAEINPGSLYYYFRSKEELLVAVLDAYIAMLDEAVMRPAFECVNDPIKRVFAVLDGYRRMLIQTGFSRGCPIGNLALELPDAGAAVRERIATNFSNWCRRIEECLDDAAGRFPPGFDRAALARFVLTVMEGGIMQSRAHREIGPYDAGVAQLRDYVNRLTGAADAE